MGVKSEATVEDLYRVAGKAELVHGELRLMPPTGGLPGYAAAEILVSLRAHARHTRRGYAIGDNVAFLVDLPHRKSFCPDTAYYVGKLRMKFLEGAPIVEVSSVTGAGIDQLRLKLADAARSVRVKDATHPFRLPIDRSFTMRGHGSVVTGTLISGRLTRDDELVLLPSGRAVKVRGLHVHGEMQASAMAGQRVAVNLAGVEVAEVSRGETLTTPNAVTVTKHVDVRLELLPSARPLNHGARVRFHQGTRETAGRVVLPDATILLDYLLGQMVKILDGLRVYPDRMRENLDRSYGLVYSQRVLLALTEAGLGRQPAYEVVQRNAMRAWEERRSFLECLEADPEVARHLTSEALKACFDPAWYLRHVDAVFRRVGLVHGGPDGR